MREEKEVLLDDLFLEMDEVEERHRTERGERTELDGRLRDGGENMRSRVLYRKGSSEGSANDGENS